LTHVHIAGVCGTFMGGVARLATELGYRVSGSDTGVYPPMSDQLAELGVELREGYLAEHICALRPDQVIIGNALSRGNPLVEKVLNDRLPYCSGPEWLARHVLAGRRVMAVAGTHGKTTTSSLLAWILDQADMEPGFLIGGVPANFGVSARLGSGACFVVEADEYDTAFFDKRSKFVHYRPDILALNNLEFDHADIFDDLAAVMRQFHHLVRTVPGTGRLIVNGDDGNLESLLEMGCWTPVERFGGPGNDWQVSGGAGELLLRPPGGAEALEYQWTLKADYNAWNAAAALAAASHAGAPPASAGPALTSFRSVKRRLELVARKAGATVYDDFAHHPTAVEKTIKALAAEGGGGRVICIFEPRSNTMKMGVQRQALNKALRLADRAFVYRSPDLQWDAGELAAETVVVLPDTGAIIEQVCRILEPGDCIVVMSNGGFEDLTRRLVARLAA